MEEDIEAVPTFLSTVTPGKFPTFWLRPVSVLNNELFPLLGFPTKAIWMVLLFTKVQPTKISSEPVGCLRYEEEDDAMRSSLAIIYHL